MNCISLQNQIYQIYRMINISLTATHFQHLDKDIFLDMQQDIVSHNQKQFFILKLLMRRF